ncbi:12907_t:CDS:1, partial [Funneliformis geosporum]
TLPLLKLAHQPKPQEPLTFPKKLATKLVPQDFQEYLLTSLLLLAKQAEFVNLPLEQPQVPHNGSKCDQLDYTHFQKKPIIRFKFARARASLVKEFMLNLDHQAQTFDLDEAQNFTDNHFPDPLNSRNAYLNR